MKKFEFIEGLDDLSKFAARGEIHPPLFYISMILEKHMRDFEKDLVKRLVDRINGSICKKLLCDLVEAKGVREPGTNYTIMELPTPVSLSPKKEINHIKTANDTIVVNTHDWHCDYLTDTELITVFHTLEEQGCFEDDYFDCPYVNVQGVINAELEAILDRNYSFLSF